jgi:hypothetical protein
MGQGFISRLMSEVFLRTDDLGAIFFSVKKTDFCGDLIFFIFKEPSRFTGFTSNI